MNTILTNIGEQLASNGFITGVMPKISKVWFGDGGGSIITPTKDTTQLVNKITEGVGTTILRLGEPNRLYIYTQIPNNIGDFTLREIGLLTDDGTLIAYGGGFEQYKPPVSESNDRFDYYITIPLSSTQDITISFSNDNEYAPQESVDVVQNGLEARRLEIVDINNRMPNKVEYSDIVDNVVTSDNNKPLSAKQGKILKDLVDTKQNIIQDNTLAINKLNISGGTEINDDLIDSDTFIVDDGNNNTVRKSLISRMWTYINSKLTGAISTVVTSNLTASRVVVSNSSGKIGVSGVTATELGYLSGVSSSVQTQLNGKAATNQAMHIGTTSVAINRASASLSLTGVSIDGTAGSANTATKLATARTIAISGGATGTATSFDGTGNISIPITGLNASNLNSGTVPDGRLSGVYSGMTLKLNGNNTVFTTESSGSANTSRTVYGLAEYKNNSASTTGAIVFIAPNTNSNIMHQLEVSGLLYTQNIVSLIVQGHRITGAWSDLRKISTGTVDIQVRWGVTPDGKNCLILGDVGTVWSYPHIAITRAMFSYTGINDTYCIGWTVALVTSFTGYTNISANIGDSTMIGNVSSADTATKLTTARLIGGVSFDGTANITLPGVNTAGNQNTSGNAATATKLNTNRSNYKGVTDSVVVGELMWKNYGNEHTIFDASNSKTPTGVAKNNTDPDISWVPTYPTLMGYNGIQTYGVRVDSSRYADRLKTPRTITIGATGKSVDGSGNVIWAHTDIGVAADTANTLALRDSSGDVTARLFRSTYANEAWVNSGAAVMMRVNNSTDNYIRPITPAGFKAWMQANNLDISAYEHSKSFGNNGYMRFTNGLIIQWGINIVPGGVYAQSFPLPISFPRYYLASVAGNTTSGTLSGISCGSVGDGNSLIRLYSSRTLDEAINWIALGC